MMRRTFSVALVSLACLLMAGSASANITVDLQWVDNGTATLTISPGDNPANGLCSGFFAASNGRCMKVIWTVGANGLYVGSNSVQWAGGAGLSAASAAYFPGFLAIPVGKASAFGPFPAANQAAKNIGISSVVGFTGAVPASEPSSTNYLGAGTYTVGTIVFNTSGASGSFSISSFLVGGFDDFYDSANTLSAVQLNGATLNVVPEPGTASLLGLGLMGLMAASRRRRNA